MDTLNTYLDRFGFGKKLDIDFPGEKAGNYPSSTFYTDWFKNPRWNSVWIRSVGIGQGELLTTNIQLANAAAMIANRGWYYTPHIVKGFNDENKQIPLKYRTKINVGIKTQHFEPVIDGMEKASWQERQKVVLLPIFPSAEKREPQKIPQERITLFSFALPLK